MLFVPAQHSCPHCHSEDTVFLVLASSQDDKYYSCRSCGQLWKVHEDADGSTRGSSVRTLDGPHPRPAKAELRDHPSVHRDENS